MTTREELIDLMIDEVTTRDRVRAAQQVTAIGRLWKAVDKALRLLDGQRTEFHAGLWVLGVAIRRLCALGVTLDSLLDLVHANVAAHDFETELRRQAIAEALERQELEN
jgi:hypothetical protein